MPETRNQVVIIERAAGHLETDDERDGICLAVRDALGEKVEIVDMAAPGSSRPEDISRFIQACTARVTADAPKTLAVIVGNVLGVEKGGGGGNNIARAAARAGVPHVFMYADGQGCKAKGVLNIMPRLGHGQGHRMAIEPALRRNIDAWEAGLYVDEKNPTPRWRRDAQ